MIKGVSKNIVEINDTGNMYFERAVLYIRPEMNDVPRNHLVKEASEYISSCVPDKPSVSGKARKNTSAAVLITASVLSAAAALTVILLISR